MFRVLEALRWQVPDWIVVPGGNLGNSSAFGKAFIELKENGLIDRVPRLAVINAAGADTLYELFERRGVRWNGGHVNMDPIRQYNDEMDRNKLKADTIASAIEINRPVNLKKCLRALEFMDGVWCGRSAIKRFWTRRRKSEPVVSAANPLRRPAWRGRDCCAVKA